MHGLLLSAYHASSHDYWSRGVQTHLCEHQWTQEILPPRYFNWRIRGNALYLATRLTASQLEKTDFVLATSMVDLAGLRSLCPALTTIPTALYFHENQFEYPGNNVQQQRIEPQMMTLFSALSAQLLLFNSDYNRRTFLQGARALLRKMPDFAPLQWIDQLQQKSHCIPVPLETSAFSAAAKKSEPVSFIWNHRWEHDKGPERLLAALRLLLERGNNFRMHVVGQQFRRQPEVFADIQQLLSASGTLGAWGFQENKQEYSQLLQQSHGVISTALHDFQGLAVQEAVAAGCYPLLPNRLAYPEWFGVEACYASSLESPQQEALALSQAMQSLIDRPLRQPVDLQHLSWQQLRPHYQKWIAHLTSSGG